MITQKRLKEVLHYNPDTGLFTWIAHRQGVKVGSSAGNTTVQGYRIIGIDGKRYMAHRAAWLYMTGSWPKNQIDHINHIRDDNRIINLREVTHKENKRNQPINKNNTSGVTGVYWNKPLQMWHPKIMVNSKSINLGTFIDKFEAICARKSANNKYGFHPNHGTK